MTDRRTTHDRSWRTADRGPPGPVGGVAPTDSQEQGLIYTVEQIGPRRELKKNGDLVCFDVPIARVGDMLYGPGEVPVMPNPTSPSVYVQRTAEELFRPETIASFYGAAVVDEHPDFNRFPKGVTPDNFKELAGGFAINPRRGKDGDQDVLLADLIITRRDLIEAIESGKREISAGYDAAYETIRPGLGRQYEILANHIALVSKGRCGPRCAIGDHATIDTTQQEAHMPGATQGAQGTPRRRFDAATLDALEGMVQEGRRSLALVDDADQGAVHVHIHNGPTATHDKRMAADAEGDDDDKGKDKDDKGEEEGYAQLKKTVDALADSVGQIGAAVKAMSSDRSRTKDGEGDDKDDKSKTADADGDDKGKDKDDKSMTGDSAALATSWQQLAANAEVLVPGFKMPTFDSAAQRKLTVDSMCGVRRTVLTQLAATQDGAALIAGLSDDPLDKMDCPSVAVAFNAAAKAKASSNNAAATRDAQTIPGAQALGVVAGRTAPVSISAINDQNKSFWSRTAKKA